MADIDKAAEADKREGQEAEVASEGGRSRRAARARERVRDEPAFGPLNWCLALIGVAALVFGFYLLSRANPQGDNLEALISPFVILGAYGVVFVAIVLRVDGSKR